MDAIENSKSRDLGRLIYAVGIPNVGLKTGQILAKRFGSMENIMAASAIELMEIDDIGEVTAQCIEDWMKQASSIEMINRLKDANLNFACNTVTRSSPYTGMTFVLTGSLQTYTRDEATALIEELGAKTSSSVSKNTNYVVIGERAGSKLKRAQELGIPIMTEAEFMELVNQYK